MVQKEVIEKIMKIVDAEERKIKEYFSKGNTLQRKAILLELVRAMDVFYLNPKRKINMIVSYPTGFNEVIRLIYGDYVNEMGYALGKSNKYTWAHANSLIQHTGRIGFCKKNILALNSNLAEATVKDSEIKIVFKDGLPENEDSDAFWKVYYSLRKDIKPFEKKITKGKTKRISQLLNKHVEVWREHYIRYSSTPEIDEFYDIIAYLKTMGMLGLEEFTNEDEFGGIPYLKYYEAIMGIYAMAVKHYDFALHLINKNKDIEIENIATISRERSGMIKSLSDYTGLTLSQSEQILDCLTLSPENYKYHTENSTQLSVPFIKIGKNTLINSIFGSIFSPFEFLNRELKRRFKSDYFNAVNKREEKFRRHIYSFFSGENYSVCLKSLNINTSKGPTDIDAAVYDLESDTLALFQLKWQDLFSTIKERNSRINNLYPSVSKWLDKIEALLNETKDEELWKKLRFPVRKKPSKVYVLVICRHNAFFSGIRPDKRAAWASIWHLASLVETKKIPEKNKIQFLYNEVKKNQEKIFNKVLKKGLFGKFEIGGITFNLIAGNAIDNKK